jgi:hypothetical protein
MRFAPTWAVRDGELTKVVSEQRRGSSGDAQWRGGGFVLRRGRERAPKDSRHREGAKRVRRLPKMTGVMIVWRGKSSSDMTVSYGGA